MGTIQMGRGDAVRCHAALYSVQRLQPWSSIPILERKEPRVQQGKG